MWYITRLIHKKRELNVFIVFFIAELLLEVHVFTDKD